MRARLMIMGVLAAVVLVGCSGADEGQSTASDGPAMPQQRVPDSGDDGDGAGGDSADDEATEQADPGAEADEGSGGVEGDDESTAGSDGVAESQLAERERQLARTATLDLRVADVGDAAADARRIASRGDGYTGAERSSGDSATLTLAVPADDLESTLDELAELGTPDRREITSDDVTDSVVDTDSRIETQRASVRRARALFEEAETISEITSVERELSKRESELESLLARQKALSAKVAMAPIDLRLREHDAPPPPDDDGGFVDGLAGGWSAFTSVLGGAAHGIGAAMPFVLAIGVPLGTVGWWLRRRRAGRGSPQEPAPAEVG